MTTQAAQKTGNEMDPAVAQQQHAAKQKLKELEAAQPTLRDVLLNRPLRKKKVTLDRYENRVVEVREPTCEVRDEYMRRIDFETESITDKEDRKGRATLKINGDVYKAWVWLVITCSFNAETGERLFDGNDEKKLMKTSANGFVSPIAEAAIELMNKGEETAKNSDATQNDS